MASRTATLSRKTSESSIELSLDLDGTGTSNIDTSVPFFDHLLREGDHLPPARRSHMHQLRWLAAPAAL